MNELVMRLAEGQHPVEISLRAGKTAENLKESIDRGYVLVKFTGTRGGTELGVRLDSQATDIRDANFGEGTGSVSLVGGLTLNYVKVRCIANIDIQTFTGMGHLEVADEAAQ